MPELSPGVMSLTRKEFANIQIMGLILFKEKGVPEILSDGPIEKDIRDILSVEVAKGTTWKDRESSNGEEREGRKSIFLG